MKQEREPQPIADLVARFVSNVGLGARMELARLTAAWAEAVGETIASHSTPVSLDNGVLTVRADSAVWASELKLLSSHVASAASRFLDGAVVSEVRIRVGPDGQNAARRGSWAKRRDP